MKTAIDWFDELKVPFDGDVTIKDLIEIQDDARADLLDRIKELELELEKLKRGQQ